jgi:hypothetical protein
LVEVLKHPVKIRNPEDKYDYDQAVQDGFDLSLHRDEPVHEPQHKPCCDNRDNYGSEWHIMFSNSCYWLRSRLGAPRRKVPGDELTWRGDQKEEGKYSASFLFFQVTCEIAEQ